MKKSFKIPIIFSLIFTLVFFSIFCCCLTQMAHAEKVVPSCHQAKDQNNQSQHNQECNCDKNISSYEAKIFTGVDLIRLASIVFDHRIPTLSAPDFTSSFTFQKAPLIFASTLPLFIQNPNLRI